MTQSIKVIFDAKVNLLNPSIPFYSEPDFQIAELKKLKAHWSKEQVAEVDDILARLEHAKKTIIDLEKKKLDLTQEERRLKERYDEEELRFKTTVSDTTHNSDLNDTCLCMYS